MDFSLTSVPEDLGHTEIAIDPSKSEQSLKITQTGQLILPTGKTYNITNITGIVGFDSTYKKGDNLDEEQRKFVGNLIKEILFSKSSLKEGFQETWKAVTITFPTGVRKDKEEGVDAGAGAKKAESDENIVAQVEATGTKNEKLPTQAVKINKTVLNFEVFKESITKPSPSKIGDISKEVSEIEEEEGDIEDEDIVNDDGDEIDEEVSFDNDDEDIGEARAKPDSPKMGVFSIDKLPTSTKEIVEASKSEINKYLNSLIDSVKPFYKPGMTIEQSKPVLNKIDEIMGRIQYEFQSYLENQPGSNLSGNPINERLDQFKKAYNKLDFIQDRFIKKIKYYPKLMELRKNVDKESDSAKLLELRKGIFREINEYLGDWAAESDDDLAKDYKILLYRIDDKIVKLEKNAGRLNLSDAEKTNGLNEEENAYLNLEIEKIKVNKYLDIRSNSQCGRENSPGHWLNHYQIMEGVKDINEEFDGQVAFTDDPVYLDNQHGQNNLASKVKEILENDKLKDKRFISIPISVHDNHWVSVIIDQGNNPPTIKYFDSKKNYANMDLVNEQITEIQKIYKDKTKKDLRKEVGTKQSLQPDDYQCGIWVLFFLRNEILKKLQKKAGDIVNKDDQLVNINDPELLGKAELVSNQRIFFQKRFIKSSKEGTYIRTQHID